MRNLFKPDSGLMIVMSQITDCIFLSLFFMLGCLPVVTVGASLAALYDSVFRGFRDGEKNTWQRFWHTYLQSLKASLLPSLVFLVVAGLLAYGMIQCWNGAVYGQIGWLLFAAVLMLEVIAVGILSVLFPMLSRFENDFATLLKNTVLLAMANLPRTMLLGMINAISLLLCLQLLVPLFFLPALAALIGSLLIEPMFRPYLPEEPEEDEIEEAEEEAAE